MRFFTIVVVAFSLPLSAPASEVAYTCTVTNVYSVSANGALNASGFEEALKNGSFSVSRVTGEIIGDVIPTQAATSKRVVREGSKKNSFKAIADFGNEFQILEIQEFRSSAIKPFVAMSMSGVGVVTGTCKK